MKINQQPTLPGLNTVQTTIILGLDASDLVRRHLEEMKAAHPGIRFTPTDILRSYIEQGLRHYAETTDITLAKDFSTYR